MFSSIVKNWNAVNRREMFRQGGLLTVLERLAVRLRSLP